MRNRLMVASLVALAVSAVFFSVSAQQATRMFGTLSADLATGKSTPVTCTQSGTGCFLDVQVAGGSATMSSLTFTNGTVLSDSASGKLLVTGTTPMLQLGGTTSSFSALKGSGTNVLLRLADDSASGIIFGRFGTFNMLVSDGSPTISSGFGTSPSIVAHNGPASFRINVGTGGAATSGVVGLPGATTGWNCQVTDMTNNTATRQTASTTTTATFTAAAAWAASDILTVSCFAY